MRPLTASLLVSLVGLAAAAPLAGQQRHDSNAPVEVSADSAELQDKQHRSILTGNVVIRQAEMTLNAARVTLALTGEVVGGNPQISRVDAAGGVTVRRPDQTARSQFAIYDLNRRLITMLGAVTLTQGGNTVNGGRLTINLDTGRAVIDGSSVAGSTGATGSAGTTTTQRGGRVSGVFSVPKRD
jgi:lipopolysaccharide export system protein LptA